MRESGYYIFFIHTANSSTDSGTSKPRRHPRSAGLPWTGCVWHPASSVHPAVAASTQPAPGVLAGGWMMPTPMLVVSAQPSSQRHLPRRGGGPTFPRVFSIYLTAWLCKCMGAISRVVTPPRDLLLVHWGSPSALILQERVQLCMPTGSAIVPWPWAHLGAAWCAGESHPHLVPVPICCCGHSLISFPPLFSPF